ncbi:MAG: transcriptional repressor LexA [Aggregatilineales bacterium]
MKPFDKLSERQRSILVYMEQYVSQHGYPPTIREIGLATGINSTSVVNYNLNKLVAAGYLERSDRVSRGIRLVAPLPGSAQPPQAVRFSSAPLTIPLVGQIVASEPVPVYDDAASAGDSIEVTPAILGGADASQVFALRVKGDSMIDAMIADGDIVLLRRQSTGETHNGQMVAVWLEDRGETTLKRFYHEGAQVRLQPANPHYQPILVSASACHVQGRVVSVIRQLR